MFERTKAILHARFRASLREDQSYFLSATQKTWTYPEDLISEKEKYVMYSPIAMAHRASQNAYYTGRKDFGQKTAKSYAFTTAFLQNIQTIKQINRDYSKSNYDPAGEEEEE